MPAKETPILTPLNRILSPLLNLHPPNTPPDLYASALHHFTSIPWCAALLHPSSPPGQVIPFIPQCFNPLTPQHDQFVGATLASHPRGLRHMLSFFYHAHDAALRDPNHFVREVHTLFSLADGLSGYRGLIHGGVTATMMDEAMGTVNEINTALGKHGLVHQRSSVTAELDVKFLRPVPAPGVVCVTAWTEGIEGRKTRMRCEVKDGEGTVLARGASTWIALKPSL
ncbi:hypothetical protein E4U42_000693 [Claviceps africana]|uniref:Thioesterase domain-containing protein n=1 Tax=Claviceps africana TaxID=83212 RepID=A0A8K0JCN7_9HYPO|nr:hypothetical protein E4U42_000693 [Claviceps africana]